LKSITHLSPETLKQRHEKNTLANKRASEQSQKTSQSILQSDGSDDMQKIQNPNSF
jgi:hypothetical protein